MSDKARELFLEGLKSVEGGDWEKGYASLFAAWTLTQHYQVAGNLGVCEVELKHYRDGAEHLAYALREMDAAGEQDPEARAFLQQALERALKEVGSVSVSVDAEGAEVLVDGKAVGTAPIGHALYVDPGKHVLRARAEGLGSAEETIEALPGSSHAPVLSLRAAGDGGVMAYRTPVMIGGFALAGAALIGGVIATVVSNGKAGEAEDGLAELTRGGNESPCYGPGAPAACGDVLAANESRDSAGNAAIGLFVGGGLITAGTVIFAVVTRSKAPAAGSVNIAPVALPGRGGIILSGSF